MVNSGASIAAKSTDLQARVTWPAQAGFATAATAKLFETLGWQVSASSRRHKAYHKPLRCCFVLRDGAREEAAFGYTGVTAPLDGDNPDLCVAQTRVERFLRHLGETSAVLVQNTPLIAFGGPRRDRLVVFGGWRFHDRVWRPFVLGPEGLGGVGIQTTFFEARTAPHHMAEIFGAPANKTLPKVTKVVSAIAAFGASKTENKTENKTGRKSGRQPATGLRIVPFADGWSMAQAGAPAALTMMHPDHRAQPANMPHPASAHRIKPLILGPNLASPDQSTSLTGPLNPLAPNALPWEIGEDEFRFRHRKTVPRK